MNRTLRRLRKTEFTSNNLTDQFFDISQQTIKQKHCFLFGRITKGAGTAVQNTLDVFLFLLKQKQHQRLWLNPQSAPLFWSTRIIKDNNSIVKVTSQIAIMNNRPQYVRWDNHRNHLQTMFSHQFYQGRFCDVILACEDGQTIKAHRSVLCACSGYFDSVLNRIAADKDTLVILKDCNIFEIKLLISFMYNGEISVDRVGALISFYIYLTKLFQILPDSSVKNPSHFSLYHLYLQNRLASLRKTAECLQVNGLVDALAQFIDDPTNNLGAVPMAELASSSLSSSPWKRRHSQLESGPINLPNMAAMASGSSSISQVHPMKPQQVFLPQMPQMPQMPPMPHMPTVPIEMDGGQLWPLIPKEEIMDSPPTYDVDDFDEGEMEEEFNAISTLEGQVRFIGHSYLRIGI